MSDIMDGFVMIEAAVASGSNSRVIGLAYSGGKMKLPGWKFPVVVDLAGMTVPESVPLLSNHENKTASRVGMVKAEIEDFSLTIDGEIVSSGDIATGIIEQAKAGADWQLSIGAEVKNAELVKGSREVNGQVHAGPFYHIKESVLREVSVVPVGADMSTSMKLAASFNLFNPQGERMDKETTPEVTVKAETATKEATPTEVKASGEPDKIQAALDAERQRVNDIQTLCNGEHVEIEREAISAGWDMDQVRAKLLDAIRTERPQADFNIAVKRESSAGDSMKQLEAAMCLRMGIDDDIMVKSYGELVLDQADRIRDISLKAMFERCLQAEGMSVPASFGNDTIKAAFSTVSLPGILGNVANKKLLQSFNAQPVIATRLCSTGDLNDFKLNERFRLTDAGDLQPIGADGEIKDGKLVEEKASNQLETFAKKFVLTRKMVINDDLGAFMKVPTAMGNRAARLIDQLFFTRLLANPTQGDGSKLFSTKHNNLLSGADSVLAKESLGKAIQSFLDQTDADGQPINVEPQFLLVPTALKHWAIELTRSAALIIAGGAESTVRPALNALADENLNVISSPYLANPKYTGSSDKAWYLFGNPNQIDTFEIGFLKGKRTPTVEHGETDFNTLGMWFRVYFDLGVREQDFRGMVKGAGE
jgi:hypothetical protein